MQGDASCGHISATDTEGWSAFNKRMCDRLHRGEVVPDPTKDTPDDPPTIYGGYSWAC